MPASGESATLRLEPLGEAVNGWCAVAGHRAAGMTMRVIPTGTSMAVTSLVANIQVAERRSACPALSGAGTAA